MDVFAADQDIALTIPFTDLSGEDITPLAMTRAVLDEKENVLSPATTVVLPGPVGTQIIITIPAALNALGAGVSQGLRTIEVVLTTSVGPVIQRVSYIIRSLTILTILENSFQTWGEAQLYATEIPNLLSWPVYDDFTRQTALMQAYRKLTRYSYFVRWPKDIDDQRYLQPMYDRRIAPHHWPVMTSEQWLTWYPEEFRAALRRAQIIEADIIVGGDKVNDKRRAGVLSETIGESSMMFRVGKPLDLGICDATLRELTGYLDFRLVTTRT